MGTFDYIIFAIVGWIMYKANQRLRRRILFLEQRWAELQRRRSIYADLSKPSEKALREMGDFGIDDIEKTVAAERIKQREKHKSKGSNFREI